MSHTINRERFVHPWCIQSKIQRASSLLLIETTTGHGSDSVTAATICTNDSCLPVGRAPRAEKPNQTRRLEYYVCGAIRFYRRLSTGTQAMAAAEDEVTHTHSYNRQRSMMDVAHCRQNMFDLPSLVVRPTVFLFLD
jgi:hypothetical protein